MLKGIAVGWDLMACVTVVPHYSEQCPHLWIERSCQMCSVNERRNFCKGTFLLGNAAGLAALGLEGYGS